MFHIAIEQPCTTMISSEEKCSSFTDNLQMVINLHSLQPGCCHILPFLSFLLLIQHLLKLPFIEVVFLKITFTVLYGHFFFHFKSGFFKRLQMCLLTPKIVRNLQTLSSIHGSLHTSLDYTKLLQNRRACSAHLTSLI